MGRNPLHTGINPLGGQIRDYNTGHPFTFQQAALLLSCSLQHLHDLCSKRAIIACRKGDGTMIIYAHQLNRYIAARVNKKYTHRTLKGVSMTSKEEPTYIRF